MTRKYGADIAEVLEWAEESRDRLTRLVDDPARQESLEQELTDLRQALGEQAAQLMKARQKPLRVWRILLVKN